MNTKYLFIAIAFLAGCSAAPEDPEARLAALKEEKSQLETKIADLESQLKPTQDENLRKVALTTLETSHFKHFIDLQGRVEADKSLLVTSRMPGTLVKVHVENGDHVRQGQLMAELDNGVLLKSLDELEGQLELATDLYERQQSLWDQKIGSEVQLLQAKNGKESLERSIATLKENISQTNIYAPTSGLVDNVMLRVGEAISPGIGFCILLNLEKLKIKGDVTEAYVSKVKEGDEVIAYFPDSKEEISTTVSYVSKSINPVNRTFTVECKLKTDKRFTANQIAVMRIVDYENPSAITIPVNLIQRGEGGEYVLTAQPSGDGRATVRKMEVTQGEIYNGYVEILTGLDAGEKVISTGFRDVTDGETILY